MFKIKELWENFLSDNSEVTNIRDSTSGSFVTHFIQNYLDFSSYVG
jgi:hypothetical protein